MTKPELAAAIFRSCYLEGDFLLRSGRRSREYFDKYGFESSPELLRAVAGFLARLIPPSTEILAGLETGGIPIATALSLKTGLPCRFVRKESKAYGTKRLCEGGEIRGKKLCLIEDIVTTGGQALDSLKKLKADGALIPAVLCVIFRGEAAPPPEGGGSAARADAAASATGEGEADRPTFGGPHRGGPTFGGPAPGRAPSSKPTFGKPDLAGSRFAGSRLGEAPHSEPALSGPSAGGGAFASFEKEGARLIPLFWKEEIKPLSS